MPKILFLLKKRVLPETTVEAYNSFSSGLTNSAKQVVLMLNGMGCTTQLSEVIDSNGIDREVSLFDPDIVVIEAFWAYPEKFIELSRLHPHVKWVIRNHSNMPFLANEGIAIDWIYRYLTIPRVYISCNSARAYEELTFLASKYLKCSYKKASERLIYLPNYYVMPLSVRRQQNTNSDIINVGCFGAIRPMKNHVIQAIGALKFADKIGKELHFHVNGTRIEQKGDSAHKNLQHMFNVRGATLIEHPWMPHKEFLKVVSSMDLGTQVSFSETFNIVTADMVSHNIPVVTSSEIEWVSPLFHASTTHSDDIASKMNRAWLTSKVGMHYLNKRRLKAYLNHSQREWKKNLIQRQW